jgi:hypothetical protein
MGKYVADHIEGAKYVELPGRNLYHLVEEDQSTKRRHRLDPPLKKR